MEQLFYCTLSAIFGGAIGALIAIYRYGYTTIKLYEKFQRYRRTLNEVTYQQYILNREMMDGIKMCQNEILKMKSNSHRFK